jgi:hypothetical protein
MSVWEAADEPVPGGRRYTLGEGGEPMSRARLLSVLRDSGEFADWYSALLADAPWPAFYWENPPLVADQLKRAAEFVLIDAPPLAGMTPDAETFRAHFDDGSGVVAFPNLGGDALLVAPEPAAEDQAYPHLAAFLRRGPREQRRELWHRTARAVLERIGTEPLWLSTSGTGVAWLHVRLDRRPKYYQHAPYRRAP